MILPVQSAVGLVPEPLEPRSTLPAPADADRASGLPARLGSGSTAGTGRGNGVSITVRDLWKTFGARGTKTTKNLASGQAGRGGEQDGRVTAVRDVSLDIAAGEMFVVMGLSGSGKSTLVRCLTRLIEPTAGSVAFGDVDITAARARELRDLRRTTFSMVFQNFGLLPHLTVAENVAYGLKVRGERKSDRMRRAEEVIDLVGLNGNEEKLPSELSGGMQQRVGLARALAVDPDVMFFDEPFSALDPMIRKDMQAEIVRLHKVVGKTMVFITHDLSEALKLGDRIAIMKDGAIVQVASGEELVGAPANDYVRKFVEDVSVPDVLTIRWIMEPPGEHRPEGPGLSPDTVIRDAVGSVLSAEGPLAVVENGRVVGIVTKSAILAVLSRRS